MAIVVVERFNQQSLYGLSLGQPKVAIGGLTVPTCTAFLIIIIIAVKPPFKTSFHSKISWQLFL